MEGKKAPTTPARLFFSTSPSFEGFVEPAEDSDEKTRFELFQSRVQAETETIPTFEWNSYQLIFFPICASQRYYLICFDIDASKMHVIDSTLADTHPSFSSKYGAVPLNLRHCFSKMLVKCGHPKLGAIIKRCATNVMEMPWRNNVNIVDDGIYLMRHMETFFGSKEKEWSCGLTAKGCKSLEIMRMKVNSTLLLAEHNAWRNVIKNLAAAHWKEKKIKGSFENWLQNYGL